MANTDRYLGPSHRSRSAAGEIAPLRSGQTGLDGGEHGEHPPLPW
ncbi:hypothetical protein AB0I60_26790 [Actinosynnema sp. NPDC050436]